MTVSGSAAAVLRRRSTSLATLLLITLGCTPPGVTGGTIRFDDGTPVRSGSIEFRNRDGGDRFASRIADDGTFQPVSEDGTVGLPPAQYDVVVVQIVLTEDLAKEAHRHGGTVPRRYADYYTTDLTATITDEPSPLSIIVDREPN